MRKVENLNLSRRVFITSASSLLMGSRLFGMDPFLPPFTQAVQELKED